MKDRFGIEMGLDHVSTARSLAIRTMTENESQPAPAILHLRRAAKLQAKPRSYDHQDGGGSPAVAELGKKAKMSEIQSFVKEHFNIEITAGHAKTNKGKILREGKKKKPAAKKPALVKPTAAPEPKAQPAPAKPVLATANGKLIHLADIQTLKALVERVGPETLRTLIGVMAK